MKKSNLALLILAGLLALWDLTQGQEITYRSSHYQNGTICAVSTYHDGKRVERRTYFPTGELSSYAEYDPETKLLDGDEYLFWHNGEVREATEYRNGYAHGWCFGWDPSGEPTFTKVYVESREVPAEEYSKYFPASERDDEPDPSAYALRAKGH